MTRASTVTVAVVRSLGGLLAVTLLLFAGIVSFARADVLVAGDPVGALDGGQGPDITGTPGDMTATATSGAGAAVDYTTPPPALDSDGSYYPVTCLPAPDSTFPINTASDPTTTVTCSATDDESNTSTTSFTVTVNDAPPTLSGSQGDITGPVATSAAGTSVSFIAPTATDYLDGTDPVSCTVPGSPTPTVVTSGSTFPITTTTVTCSSTNMSGMVSQPFTFTVTVDDAPPVLSGSQGDITGQVATSEAGTQVSFMAPTAADYLDGTDPVSCTVPGSTVVRSGSTFPIGVTMVTCSATNTSGMASQPFTFTVTVDDAPPTVKVPEDITGQVATSASGVSVPFAVSSSDYADGSSDVVTCTVPGDPTPITSGYEFPIGTTTVTCSATNSSHMPGDSSFTVQVLDVPQFLTTQANISGAVATGAAGASVSFTTPTASDYEDGSVPVTCTIPGNPSSVVVTSGSTFPIGTTTVTCTATGLNGSNSTTFTVAVADAYPKITNLPQDFTKPANTLHGAIVSYVTPSATDDRDGTDHVACAPVSGSLFAVGTTTVTCSTTNSSDDTTHSTFQVTVVDNASPSITVPATQTRQTTSPSPIAVTYTVPTATDLVDGPVPVSCSPQSGARFTVGQTAVTCTATDAEGNSSRITFTVDVVDTTMPPAVSRLSARRSGSALRLRWQLPVNPSVSSVVISRTPGVNGASRSMIFSGLASSYSDTSAQVGVHYRYSVTVVSVSGLDSPTQTVAAALPLPRLYGPLPGAQVSSAPTLRWLPSHHATYYNVQLYFNGREILSAWPKHARLHLHRTWDYGGVHQSLGSGTYKWYVWPGFGRESAARYGRQLGSAQFTVVSSARDARATNGLIRRGRVGNTGTDRSRRPEASPRAVRAR